MFKQFLIVSILLVGLSLAEEEPQPEVVEEPKPESPLAKLHQRLFDEAADPQEAELTLEGLNRAKWLIELNGDEEGLFTEQPYNPELLIGLYSTEEACNLELSHKISQVADHHRAAHGVSNVLEYLNQARRYQLSKCDVQEIKSKLDETRDNLDTVTGFEYPSIEKFVASLDSERQELIKINDKLPIGQVANLVVAYMKNSSKAPKLLARVINSAHVEIVAKKTVELLVKIHQAYSTGLGLFTEISKDSLAFRKLGTNEKNQILVARFCQLAANVDGGVDDLGALVNEKLG